MKRFAINTFGSVVIYWALYFLARATGSSLFSSGPLDFLFLVLVYPGFYIVDAFGIQSDFLTAILMWIVFMPLLATHMDVATNRIQMKFWAING